MPSIREDTTVYLNGSKEHVREIIKNADIGLDLDDIEGGFFCRHSLTLLDFLDEKSRQESPFCDFCCNKSENSSGVDNCSIIVYDVDLDTCTIILGNLAYDSTDGYSSRNWSDWCNLMVRLYGLSVVLRQEFYTDGVFDGHDISIFELDGTEVKRAEIGPVLDFTDYYVALDSLTQKSYLSYADKLRFMISDLESVVSNLQSEIEDLKKELALKRPKCAVSQTRYPYL